MFIIVIAAIAFMFSVWVMDDLAEKLGYKRHFFFRWEKIEDAER